MMFTYTLTSFLLYFIFYLILSTYHYFLLRGQFLIVFYKTLFKSSLGGNFANVSVFEDLNIYRKDWATHTSGHYLLWI